MKHSSQASSSRSKRIWIDLDNTPHVPFFAPIIAELKRRGYTVMVTARDAYQTCQLADLFRLSYTRIGRHYGAHKMMKVIGTGVRAAKLLAYVVWRRPDLAVNHGSRSQVLACNLTRTTSLAIFDYEHTRHSVIFNATWLMAPDVLPLAQLRDRSQHALNYHGIKEDVYAPGFTPDSSIVDRLGLTGREIVAVVRPPATEAHYHRPQSDVLFHATVEHLRQASGVKTIIVPRNERQAAAVRAEWADAAASGSIVVLDHPEDGLNLIWHADFVISGGGTMNREAAALAVPVYSIFRGDLGAVDRYLAASGRLVLLESPDDVHAKIKLERRPRAAEGHRPTRSQTMIEIVDHIVSIVESSGAVPSPHPVTH
jgi:predicted glycosyltransferase